MEQRSRLFSDRFQNQHSKDDDSDATEDQQESHSEHNVVVAAIQDLAEKAPATMTLVSLAAGLGIGVILVHMLGSQGTPTIESYWRRLGQGVMGSVGDIVSRSLTGVKSHLGGSTRS